MTESNAIEVLKLIKRRIKLAEILETYGITDNEDLKNLDKQIRVHIKSWNV